MTLHPAGAVSRCCLFLFWILCCTGTLLTGDTQAMPRSEKELRAINEVLTKTTVTYGQIPSINKARYLSVTDASMYLEGRDHVFVVFFPSGPRIYPQKIMVWHEVVNEVLDGEPYCVTYAPITGSVAAYSSKVNGLSLIFDPAGTLYNNNSVLIDRNTGSKWLQILGMAFAGPLFGKGMEHVPVWWTNWQHARTMYPKALVMGQPLGGDRKAYGRDPYGSYFMPGTYYSDERILYPLSIHDRRLPPKERILGIEHDSLVLAVVESAVKAKGVINFFMGPTPLVAVYDPRVAVVRVFNRTVWDSPLLFKLDPRGGLRDVETESLWSFDGKALEGNLAGADMEELTGIYAFWFAWAAFNPETLIVPGPLVVPDSALVKGRVDGSIMP